VNLLESHLRADVIRGYLSGAFERLGFATEARLLRIQSEQLVKLIDKALEEMPAVDPWYALSSILGGEVTATYREIRRVRGKHYERIGKAEKTMMKTLRRSFNNMYKTHSDWPKRQQLQATSRMMKEMVEQSKKAAKGLLEANPSK
jgi:DnaJ-domain-containing protein 1